MYLLLGFFGLLLFLPGLFMLIRNAANQKPLKVPALIVAASVVLYFSGLALQPAAEPADPEPSADILTVHFIDVGQGDSILVDAPEKTVLVDGGNRDEAAANYLQRKHIYALDLIIATHPHADHIGGLIDVMEVIAVEEIIDPGIPHTTVTFEDYLDIIDRKKITFTEGRSGMVRELGGGVTLQIIHPTYPSEDDLNNSSIVTRIEYGQVRFLLTGDAEAEAEKDMLESGYNLKSTVLKVGHHGSSTSTTPPFLDAVSPNLSVIMAGADNQYGHPHTETLEALEIAGVKIYRTDLQGTILIKTDGDNISIHMESSSTPWWEELFR